MNTFIENLLLAFFIIPNIWLIYKSVFCKRLHRGNTCNNTACLMRCSKCPETKAERLQWRIDFLKCQDIYPEDAKAAYIKFLERQKKWLEEFENDTEK